MAVRIGHAALVLVAGLLIAGGAGVLLVVCARTWPAEGEGLLGVWTVIFAMLAVAVLIAMLFACAEDTDLRGGPPEHTSVAFRLSLGVDRANPASPALTAVRSAVHP